MNLSGFTQVCLSKVTGPQACFPLAKERSFEFGSSAESEPEGGADDSVFAGHRNASVIKPKAVGI